MLSKKITTEIEISIEHGNIELTTYSENLSFTLTLTPDEIQNILNYCVDNNVIDVLQPSKD